MGYAVKCPVCGGSGQVRSPDEPFWVRCPSCGGEGWKWVRLVLEDFNKLAGSGVRLNNPPEVAKAQLVKVINKIEALRKQTEDKDAFVWAFSFYAQVVRWLEAAKKEIG